MPRAAAPGIATTIPELAMRFEALQSAAKTLVPVEIRGESGTGKELIVRAVHAMLGNLAAVARELGKDRTQIRRWMKRFGLTRDE